jgi:N-methylhydantoinase A
MKRRSKARIIGIDTGGTFTDIFSIDLNNKKRFIKKVSSTPEDPSIAFMSGIENINLSEVLRLIHGTTHATNTIITRTGAVTGLITTKGFRDVLEIMRGNRPFDNVYNLQRPKSQHLIPRFLRTEVRERIGCNGDIIIPLHEEDVIKATKFLISNGVNSIAICFIFSYMNSEHEQKALKIIKENFPDLFVSTSSDILSEWREYERSSTTVCDAYVKPKMNRYVLNIEKKLKSRSYNDDFLIMKNNGGVTRARMAASFPVETCLSGPAAGVVAGKHFGEEIGFENIISTDMGGTSFDVGLICDCEFVSNTEAEITEGIPIKTPMIDIRTIGAGGGSIAWVDAGGALRVGPESAGAEPGPACYGLGGDKPTITDANLVLDRLNPNYFVGGERTLNKKLAEKVISKLGEKLNLDMISLSKGILAASIANMVNEIRTITTENGHDPRDFVLLSAGGAGPLHGVQIARELKIKKVLVPPYPGLMSAIGLLLSDLKFDNVKTYHTILNIEETGKLENLAADMIKDGLDLLKIEEFDVKIDCLTSLDMRYLGQNYEIKIPINKNEFDFDKICKKFDTEHYRMYGINLGDLPREVLRIRTTIIGNVGNKEYILNSIISEDIKKSDERVNKYKEKRKIHFDESNESIEAKIFDRDSLRADDCIMGPCIIEELDSTILVPSNCIAEVDNKLNIIITLNY